MRFSASSLAQAATSSTLLLSSLFGPASAAVVQKRASVCNGHAELCSKSYGSVTFVGAHDSYAVSNDASNLFANQDQNITQQLNDGVRMLQSQVHNSDGTITLCHTSCALQNSGPLLDYLKTVKTWMDSNPNEVLTLLIVNSDDLPPTQFDTVFKSAGLDTLSYTPPSTSIEYTAWPSLGSMIDSGKRLVTFLDAEANFNSVPYLIDEFTNMWETAFDVTGTFDCTVNRTKGTPANQLYTINHFLDKVILGQPAPNRDAANTTNAASGTNSLGQQVQECVSANQRNPNFMLVDFYEFGGGSVFQVAAQANGVNYSPTTPVAQPGSGTTSGTSPSVTSVSTSSAMPKSPALGLLVTALVAFFSASATLL